MEDHLVEKFLKVEFGEKLRGMGQITEDFIDQSPQIGFKEEGRTRGLRDHTAKATAYSAWKKIG